MHAARNANSRCASATTSDLVAREPGVSGAALREAPRFGSRPPRLQASSCAGRRRAARRPIPAFPGSAGGLCISPRSCRRTAAPEPMYSLRDWPRSAAENTTRSVHFGWHNELGILPPLRYRNTAAQPAGQPDALQSASPPFARRLAATLGDNSRSKPQPRR